VAGRRWHRQTVAVAVAVAGEARTLAPGAATCGCEARTGRGRRVLTVQSTDCHGHCWRSSHVSSAAAGTKGDQPRRPPGRLGFHQLHRPAGRKSVNLKGKKWLKRDLDYRSGQVLRGLLLNFTTDARVGLCLFGETSRFFFASIFLTSKAHKIRIR
jgi:hypothetical protein